MSTDIAKPMNWMGWKVRRCSTCIYCSDCQEYGAPIEWILDGAKNCPRHSKRIHRCMSCRTEISMSAGTYCDECRSATLRKHNKLLDKQRIERKRHMEACRRCEHYAQ